MGLTNIFKPLSSNQHCWLSSATTLIFPLKFFGYAGNQIRGCWVRSYFATSVQCSSSPRYLYKHQLSFWCQTIVHKLGEPYVLLIVSHLNRSILMFVWCKNFTIFSLHNERPSLVCLEVKYRSNTCYKILFASLFKLATKKPIWRHKLALLTPVVRS